MSDEPNKFIFRDGYTEYEKKNRINVDHFRNDHHGFVDQALSAAGLGEDILNKRKSRFLNKLYSRLSEEEYNQFLDGMFEQYGEKGDRANLQLFRREGLTHQTLVNTLESRGADVETDGGQEVQAAEDEEPYSAHLSYVSNYNVPESGVVDIEFTHTDQTEAVELGNGRFEDRSGHSVDANEIDVSDHDLEALSRFVQENDYTVEARVYTEEGIVAISNSKCSTGLQKAIFRAIRSWAGVSVGSGKLELRGTQLLLTQNLMGGVNSGLDYGKFKDKNVNTAKYRGGRNEILTQSEVLTPARERGEITQVRYYYGYDDGTGERQVQVRVYGDGHISTSKPVQPEFLNRIKDRIQVGIGHRSNLKTVDEIIQEYISDKSRDELQFAEESYRRRCRTAFKHLVNEYIDQNAFDDTERLVYNAVIANISVWLLKTDLGSGAYPGASTATRRPKKEQDFKTFLEDYSDYALQSTRPDFDEFWDHLERILLHNSSCSPIDLLNKAIADYDLPE